MRILDWIPRLPSSSPMHSITQMLSLRALSKYSGFASNVITQRPGSPWTPTTHAHHISLTSSASSATTQLMGDLAASSRSSLCCPPTPYFWETRPSPLCNIPFWLTSPSFLWLTSPYSHSSFSPFIFNLSSNLFPCRQPWISLFHHFVLSLQRCSARVPGDSHTCPLSVCHLSSASLLESLFAQASTSECQRKTLHSNSMVCVHPFCPCPLYSWVLLTEVLHPYADFVKENERLHCGKQARTTKDSRI